jgi:hypothetical protein
MLMVLIYWDVDVDGNLSRCYCQSIDIWNDMLIHEALIINDIFQMF